MNLVNKTSTITVAVVAALVALAVAAHGSGALRLSPAHAAVHGTEHPAAARSGSLASGCGNARAAGLRVGGRTRRRPEAAAPARPARPRRADRLRRAGRPRAARRRAARRPG